MDKKITLIILAVIAVFYLVLFVCIGAFFFGAVPVLCVLLWLFRYRRKAANCTPEAILLGLIMLAGLAITQPFSGRFALQYPLQRLYVEKKCNADIEGLFPRQLPEHSRDFRTEFMPPVMQGSGYYVVTVTADESEIDMLRKEYAEKAIAVFPVSALYENSEAQEKATDLTAEEVYIPDQFQDSAQAQCYLLAKEGNWNHPHTKLVIIDGQSICWSKLG